MVTYQTEPRLFAGLFLRRALKNTRDLTERALRNIWPRSHRSLRLDVGRTDYLAPLFGFLLKPFPVIRGRAPATLLPKSASRNLNLGSDRQPIILTTSVAVFDPYVLALDEAHFI